MPPPNQHGILLLGTGMKLLPHLSDWLSVAERQAVVHALLTWHAILLLRIGMKLVVEAV